MKINFLLVLLLGLLAVSYGFQLRGRNRGGGRGGGGRGAGTTEANDFGTDDDNDDDDDDSDDDGGRDGRRGRLPRLIVEVIARRIQQQLQACGVPELDSPVTTYKDAFNGLAMLLLADCDGGYPGSTPPGPDPSWAPPTGPGPSGPATGPTTGNPPPATSVVPAREFEDKVVRELLAYLQRKEN
ncbi:uncharacterized protein LOC134262499 [Saccostrea cucullata]|uniref:uncharacterized protein LOC134262499 n=1 Tax=Saccostrea cuccullata TaxID=36930 RepID=UPI002ED21610